MSIQSLLYCLILFASTASNTLPSLARCATSASVVGLDFRMEGLVGNADCSFEMGPVGPQRQTLPLEHDTETERYLPTKG